MSLYFLPGPTIPAGQSLSEGVDCSGSRIVRIIMPDGWTTAPLTFQLSPDNVSFHDLFSTQVTVDAYCPYPVLVPIVTPGSAVTMPHGYGDMISFIRFRSGTTSQPIAQAADRRFQIVLDVPAAA